MMKFVMSDVGVATGHHVQQIQQFVLHDLLIVYHVSLQLVLHSVLHDHVGMGSLIVMGLMV